MKLRQGFVSNSSSSSFIAVFARVEDEEKVFTSLAKIKEEHLIITGKTLKEEFLLRRWGSAFDCDWCYTGVDVSIEDIVDDALYVAYTDSGNEGDSAFYRSDIEDGEDAWDYELDYDIDLDFFDSHTQKLVNSVDKENGFVDIQIGWGAGRNG